MTEDKDIDAAAEALLAAAGADRLRRFRERFDNVPIDAKPLEPAPASVTFQTDKGTLHADEVPIRPDIPKMVRDMAEKLRDDLDDADIANLTGQVEAFIDSAPFAERIDRLRMSEPFSRVTERLHALDADLKALRMDFEIRLSPDDLHKALTCNGSSRHIIPLRGFPFLQKKKVGFNWTLPLTPLRRKMLCALIDFLIDCCAFAYRLRSDSLKLWREAYLLTLRSVGGPYASDTEVARPFTEKQAERIVSLVMDAYGMLFADGMAIQRNRELWGER